MSDPIKMDTTRTGFSATRANDARPPGSASPGARDDFEKAMREKDRNGSSENRDGDREDGQGGQMPSASSLLGSLFESKMNAAAPASVDPGLGELVDDLVQRILVSDPASGDPAEIRLQLSESVLRDTEIRLQRGPDGLLSVLLETGNAASMQTLVAARQSLSEQLEKHGPVTVRVSETNESGQGDNDANRRSQGLVDYGPETL